MFPSPLTLEHIPDHPVYLNVHIRWILFVKIRYTRKNLCKLAQAILIFHNYTLSTLTPINQIFPS